MLRIQIPYPPGVVAVPNPVAGLAPKRPPPPKAFVLVEGCDAWPKTPLPVDGPAVPVAPKAPVDGAPNVPVVVLPVPPNAPKPVVGFG